MPRSQNSGGVKSRVPHDGHRKEGMMITGMAMMAGVNGFTLLVVMKQEDLVMMITDHHPIV